MPDSGGSWRCLPRMSPDPRWPAHRRARSGSRHRGFCRRSNFPAAVFAALSLADTLLQLMEIIPGTEGAGSIVQLKLNEATGRFQQKQLRPWICRSGWPPVISEEVSYVAPVIWIWCDETKAPSGQ
jgi:hypothetical protein